MSLFWHLSAAACEAYYIIFLITHCQEQNKAVRLSNELFSSHWNESSNYLRLDNCIRCLLPKVCVNRHHLPASIEPGYIQYM
jgi:hypothetical protein